VRVVDPEAGYLGVSYPSLIPLLVEAIKEMETEFDARNVCQEQEIDSLRRENEELSKRVTAMEAAIARLAGLPEVREAYLAMKGVDHD